MKVSINIPGAGQVYVSDAVAVINRKALCKNLGICNIALCRLEVQYGFEYALNVLMQKSVNC